MGETGVNVSTTAVDEPCPHCNGTGEVISLIENTSYSCGRCGGHKTIPVEGVFWFYHPMDGGYLTQRIARISQEGDRWIVNHWRPNGPSSHFYAKRSEIFGEVRGFRRSTVAPRLLDQWSTTETWKRGLQQLEWLAYDNLFRNHPLVHDAWYKYMSTVVSMDEKLQKAKELRATFQIEGLLYG